MAAKKTAKKAAKKAAKKVPAKKAAKKDAKRAYKVRVTNPNFERKKEVPVIRECDGAMMARALTPEEEAYERGKRHALSENLMVSTAAQISGVRNNLKHANREQGKDTMILANIKTRMSEREISIDQMRDKLIELEGILAEATAEATK